MVTDFFAFLPNGEGHSKDGGFIQLEGS